MKRALPLLILLAACAGPERPSITYGPSRESSHWVPLPDGSRAAVDRGLEWKGTKVYLSLLGNLVAVDVASGKTLWAAWVSAYFNRLSIRRRDGEDVVELSSTEGDGIELYRLRSGEKIPGIPEAQPGTPLALLPAWSGRWSNIGKPLLLSLSTEAGWATARLRLFDGLKDAPAFGPIDFLTHVVLIVSDGDGANCAGIEATAFDDGASIRLRLQHRYFQTFGGVAEVRAFGIFCLPRRAPRTMIVEENRQSYIGGPPIWKERARLELPGDPARELEALRD